MVGGVRERASAAAFAVLVVMTSALVVGCDSASPEATPAAPAPPAPADPAEIEGARAALSRGDLPGAAALARGIVERSPSDRAALLLLADVAIARARSLPPEPGGAAESPHPTTSSSVTAPAAPEDPSRRKAERLIAAARSAWAASKLAGAVSALEAAEDADPTWAEPSEVLGALLVATGRPADALRAYERAVLKDPGRARARAAAERLRASLTSGDAAVASPADPSQPTSATLNALPGEPEWPSRPRPRTGPPGGPP